eukprot:g62287.t1
MPSPDGALISLHLWLFFAPNIAPFPHLSALEELINQHPAFWYCDLFQSFSHPTCGLQMQAMHDFMRQVCSI